MPGQPYLAAREVARRLFEEFAWCEVDAEQGQDDVGDMIAKLIELEAPQAILDEVMASRASALRVTLADDGVTDDALSFLVRDGEGPLIGYHSAQHEEATRGLLERCEKVLDYRARLI